MSFIDRLAWPRGFVDLTETSRFLHIPAAAQNSVCALWVRNLGQIGAVIVVSGHEMNYQDTYVRVQVSPCVRWRFAWLPQPAHLRYGEGLSSCPGVYPLKLHPMGVAYRVFEVFLQSESLSPFQDWSEQRVRGPRRRVSHYREGEINVPSGGVVDEATHQVYCLPSRRLPVVERLKDGVQAPYVLRVRHRPGQV